MKLNNYTDSCLRQFWELLSKVRNMTFKTKSINSHSHLVGKGNTTIFQQEDGSLIFEEKGQWNSKNFENINFNNVFHWKLINEKKMISLEHLRLGKENPLFLCYLAPTGPSTFASVNAHICRKDMYHGQIYFTKKTLSLCWRIIGPKKNDKIEYFYDLTVDSASSMACIERSPS